MTLSVMLATLICVVDLCEEKVISFTSYLRNIFLNFVSSTCMVKATVRLQHAYSNHHYFMLSCVPIWYLLNIKYCYANICNSR